MTVGNFYPSDEAYERMLKRHKRESDVIEGEYTVTDIKDLWNEAGHSGTKEEG